MRVRQRTIPFDCGVRNDFLRSTDNSRFYPGEIIPASYASMTPQQKWDAYGGGSARCNYRFGHGMAIASQAVSGSSFVGLEEIQDSLHGVKNYNNCLHTIIRGFSYPYLFAARRNLAPYDSISVYPFYRDAFDNPQIPNIPQHSGDVGGAAARAWGTMQPRFEGAISTLNFLYELKDVKKLIIDGYHLIKKITRLNMLKSIKSFVNDHGVDVSKPVSEVYLTYTFGIAPLIQDFKSIIENLVREVDNAQAAFKQKGETGNPSHYSEVLSKTTSVIPAISPKWTSRGLVTTTTFHATLDMKYTYEMRSGSQAFLKYWGLTGSAEALWNAVPFSFLVDYFLKVARSLHASERDPNVHNGELRYCESLKTVTTSGSYIDVPSYYKSDYVVLVNGEGASNGAQTTGIEATRYHRYVTSPNKGMAIPTINNASMKQYANMTALLRSFF